MSIFKKLHIKLLCLVLLVTLISYNAFESRLLPQQFLSECVVYVNSSENLAFYLVFETVENTSNSLYAIHDFQKKLINFNIEQHVDFTLMHFKSDSLKDLRNMAALLLKGISYSKDEHTSII